MSTAKPEPMISRNGWLWWKEFRMLMPLVGLLIGVAIAMFVMSSLIRGQDYYRNSYSDNLNLLIPLIFPMLFAVGAGVVLVGQERELRTIDWMASLPLPPRQWISVKFLVAMIGLAGMWLFAAICLAVIDDGYGSASRWRIGVVDGVADSPLGYPLWILHSIYLTIGGFYASWRIRSQFHAIILILALAFLPLAIVELFRAMVPMSLGRGDLRGVTFGIMVVSSSILGWLAYRAAMRTLTPTEVGQPIEPVIEAARENAPFWSTAPTYGSSWSSLIWQFIRSAPSSLGVVAGLLVVCLSTPIFSLSTGNEKAAFATASVISAIMVFVVPLTVSWLGVLVFQNDGAAERLRFLADRGASPSKVWVARHLVPLACLATGLLVYQWAVGMKLSGAESTHTLAMIPSLLTVALLAWTIYSVSQWTSQLFRTLVLSVIVSPVAAAMVVGWLLWSVAALQTPIWAVGLCSLVPMIATCWLMPRFMDSRDRPMSFVIAIGVLVILFGVPVAIATSRVIREPGMPSSLREELLAEGQKIRKSTSAPLNLSLSRRDSSIFPDTTDAEPVSVDRVMEWLETYEETPTQWMPTLAEFQQRPDLAASSGGFNLGQILNRLMFERLKFEQSGDWGEFAPWLVAASKISGALRNSTDWSGQDFADVIEIWLVDAMSLPQSIAMRSDDAYRTAADNLPTVRFRNTSRRRAVLASWARQQTGPNFAIDHGLQYQPAYLGTWIQPRRSEAIVATALSAIEGSSNDWLREMHRLQMMPSIPFEIGAYAPRLRNRPAIELIRAETLYPARFWGMQWEEDSEVIRREAGQ